MNYDNDFKTSDLALASTISLWIPVKELSWINSKKAYFHFEDSKQLEKIVKAYWTDNLEVSPRIFFQQIKQLKNRLYSDKDSNV